MANEKKMTKAGWFKQIMANHPLTEGERKFVEHELELLEKKNSGEKKPTAQQVANEELKRAIVEGMEVNRLYSISELTKEIPQCAELSTSKMSALLRQLKDEGVVKRTEEKRKAYFSLA